MIASDADPKAESTSSVNRIDTATKMNVSPAEVKKMAGLVFNPNARCSFSSIPSSPSVWLREVNCGAYALSTTDRVLLPVG